jgi:dihydroneopterin aldolase
VEVLIEIVGLELLGFHGVEEDERRKGQAFLFDVQLAVHDAGAWTDKLVDTVDYNEVVGCIREVSDSRRFNLIEALAAAVADALIERFRVSKARVRVRKPNVQLGYPVEWTAATVERLRR